MAPGKLAGTNLVILLTLGAIWGTAFPFITLGLASFSPVLFAALRFDIAGIAILTIALVRGADMVPRSRRQWTAIVTAAILNVGCYHAFLFWGSSSRARSWCR